MIRVAVFEDNKHFREVFQLLLNNTSGYTCTGAFPDCNDVINDVKAIPCDVVLMDIEMPGVSGIEATRLIKEHFPDLQILIQTVFYDDEYIFNALCAGASGYLLKSTNPAGYLEAIRDVHAGGVPMTADIARRVLALFKNNIQPVMAAKDYNLSNQEKKVLQLLVEGRSYKMIAIELYLSIDTIKSHVQAIYKKLHVHSGTEAVSLAIRDRIV